MKKWMIAVLIALVAVPAEVSAQGWLGRIGEKVVDRAKSKAESEAIDAAKGKKDKNEEAAEAQVESADDTPTTTTSSDFKRGSVIMFQDDVTAEQVGEFPSKWDLFSGTVETKTVAGVKAINLTDNAQVDAVSQRQQS